MRINTTCLFIFILTLAFSSASFAQQKKTPAKAKSPAQTSKKTAPKETGPANKGTVFFEKTSVDFGEVDEERGLQQADFMFTNIGKGEVRIMGIETSCGCTSAEWNKNKAYKQGEKDVITVYFNPKEQEGPVSRTLTVVTDGDPRITYLSVSGTVYGPTKTTKYLYPHVVGNTRMTHNLISMPHVKHNQIDSVLFRLHNTTDQWMKVLHVASPPYLKATIYTPVMEPKGFSTIAFVIYPELAKTYGPVEDMIKITTGDPLSPEKTVMFKANIEENFQMMTEDQKKSPPKIFVKEPVKDLGELYVGEVVDFDFEVMNKGKSPLVLRRAYGTCGCTVGTVSTEPIKKGKTGKVSVRFNAKNLYGNQSKNITLISNDPENPVNTLTIKARVVEAGTKK